MLVIKYLILLIVLIFIIWLVLLKVFGNPTYSESIAQPRKDKDDINLEEIYFKQSLRGYNMQEVDKVINLLLAKIACLEKQLNEKHKKDASKLH